MDLKVLLVAIVMMTTSLVAVATPPARAAAPSGWEPAQTVDEVPGGVGSPSIAMDPWGNALAAWNQWDGASVSVYASRYDNGVGWWSATLLENQSGNAEEVAVAMDSGGNAWVVWTLWDGTETNVSARRYSYSDGWAPVQTIDDLGNSGEADDPRIVMNGAGDGVLAWRQFDGVGNRLYASVSQAGGDWSQFMDVSGPAEATNHQVAIDGSGNAMVTWLYDTLGLQGGDVYANYFVNDPNTPFWTGPQMISEGTGTSQTPVVAAYSGRALIVWTEEDLGSIPSVFSRSFDAVAGWDIVALLESSSDYAGRPALALDSVGTGLAMWDADGPLGYSVLARPVSAGTWGTTVIVDTSTDGSAFSPQVGIDASGNAVAIWYQSGLSSDLYSSRYWKGVGWGVPALIESNDVGSVNDAHIAVTTGMARAVWRQAGDLWSTRFEAMDTDTDGLEDGLEAVYGSDWAERDTDADGLADGAETQAGTSPTDPDSDNDGLSDGTEVYASGSDPLSVDTDAAGLPDGWEYLNGMDPTNPLDESGDLDGDGLSNAAEYAAGTDPRDDDTDGDGVTDLLDDFPTNPMEYVDTDGDGVGNYLDPDDDGDGWADDLEAMAGSDPADPLSTPSDQDGDGVADIFDPDYAPDNDGDGFPNSDDAFPNDPTEWRDMDGDGVGDNLDNDRDGDTVDNGADAFPMNPNEWSDTDSDGIGNNADWDDDEDGWGDQIELQAGADPLNPASIPMDSDSDGSPDVWDVDDDNDGYADENDAFDTDPTEWMDTDGDGLGNNADPDDDNDAIPDTSDPQPMVPSQAVSVTVPPPEPDFDRDGVNDTADMDDDADGVADVSDPLPFNGNEWVDTDSDGIGNNADTDDDGDGWSDAVEAAAGSNPLVSSSHPADLDADGIADIYDPDIDGDGAANTADYDPFDPLVTSPPVILDYDGDGTADASDTDDDNDGTPDATDEWPLNSNEWLDTDSDGIGNNADPDDDADGWADSVEATVQTNPLLASSAPVDANSNGVPDVLEAPASAASDLDGDGTADALDPDIDGDGTVNALDKCTRDATDVFDADNDRICDNADQDDDNDGTFDAQDAFPTDPSRSQVTIVASSGGFDMQVLLLVAVLAVLGVIAAFQAVLIRRMTVAKPPIPEQPRERDDESF